MIVLELFCGTKSFSKVAQELGHETFTIDIDKQFENAFFKINDLRSVDSYQKQKEDLI